MVHSYRNNGYNIVLDVNSGSVHVVDDVVLELVPLVEEALLAQYRTAAKKDENGLVITKYSSPDEAFKNLFILD